MQEYIGFFANHPFLTAIWFVLFFAIIYTFVQAKFSAFTRVNTQQLTMLVNKQDATVLDIRGQADYNKGHIAGALNIPTEQVEGGKNAKLEKLKSRPIIVVCTAGMSASKVANQLAQAGFENVNILDGGMNAWSNANLPVAKG
ncbi:rhodanese-like domain-containing protein [Catenovulum sp. 2E275]|uniref:rhodanese-like domain-containing protein n=1 Tax=Catenovulum sp. 2E275 TaxID=2980497 RepID=UPI0021D371A5|nr:rhodanese-like domain-containing protein [Catenovulum sp. 2E275]MCU4677186.1 rhodanese-like domain-containing protein [Catenovulum sp. 2E275]